MPTRIINSSMEYLAPAASSGASKTLSTTAKTLSTLGVTLPATAPYYLIQPQGGNIRMTFDGTNPTALVGYQKKDGVEFTLSAALAAVVKMIVESTDTVIYVQPMSV